MRPIRSRPLDRLLSRPVVRILRYLVTHPGAYTGRELAEAGHVAQARAVEALATLGEMGVVRRRRAGRAFVYALNEESFLVSDILRPAFTRESEWLERLGAETLRAAGRQAESVLLYGSWARGRPTERSDVDLLVVSRRGAARAVGSRLDRARLRLSERFGRSISLLVLSRDDLVRRLGRGDRLVRDIIREGRVLNGKPLTELVHRG